MTKQHVVLTELSFIGGVLRPAGYEIEVDETELGAKVGSTAKPSELHEADAPVSLTPNLKKVGKGKGDEPVAYEVGAVSPTGPAPTAPQATPSGTIEPTPGAFVAPAETEAGGSGVAVIAQGSERAAGKPIAHKK